MAEVRGGFFKASYVASGNLDAGGVSGLHYRFVNFSGNDVYYPATSGSVVLGVVQNKPRDNEHASLVTLGHTKIILANSLGGGIPIMTGNSGFAVEAQSGQYVAGYLVTGATSGGIAEMIFSPWRAFGDPTP